MNTLDTPDCSKVVLVVDDDPDARRWLSHYLTGCVYMHPPLFVDIVEADSGKSAVTAIHEHPVDFVFLDYFMPDLNGLDCLTQILEINPDLPVIILTGVDSTRLAAEAIKQGACDFTVKNEASLQEIHRTLWKGLEWGAMRRRIRLQAGQLLKAEQHRVMLESLAAACHHLGQPATVILTSLDLLKHRDLPQAQMEQIMTEVQVAADRISDTLKRMQDLQAYHTEAYLPGSLQSSEPVRMLVI